ncbi:MAG: hypothetical protein AAB649_00250, partial [Patescibacteria group bacterium]
MHTYFIGDQAAITRVEALAQETIKHGHTVTIANASSNTLLSCIHALFLRANTIHVHGLKAGILLYPILFLMQNTTALWTISTLPSSTLSQRFLRILLPYIASKYQMVFSTTRTLQYLLLSLYLVKSEYIPDGYSLPTLNNIRPAVYGLRKQQYGIVLATNSAQLLQIAKTYKTLKNRKKLVVFSERTHKMFTTINLPLTSRGAISLVRQAAFVLIADPEYSPLALQAMDSGRTIIATTNSLHEELLGTTAHYFAQDDYIQLEKLFRKTAKNRSFSP